MDNYIFRDREMLLTQSHTRLFETQGLNFEYLAVTVTSCFIFFT